MEDKDDTTETAGANRKRGNRRGPPEEQQDRRSGTGRAEGRRRAANRDQRHKTIGEQHSKQKTTAGGEATTIAGQGVGDHQQQDNDNTDRGDSYRVVEQ